MEVALQQGTSGPRPPLPTALQSNFPICFCMVGQVHLGPTPTPLPTPAPAQNYVTNVFHTKRRIRSWPPSLERREKRDMRIVYSNTGSSPATPPEQKAAHHRPRRGGSQGGRDVWREKGLA